MNILLSLQLQLRSQHLVMEEILTKAKSGQLSDEDILSYEDSLQKDVSELDDVNEIIKDEKLSCFSSKKIDNSLRR